MITQIFDRVIQRLTVEPATAVVHEQQLGKTKRTRRISQQNEKKGLLL